MSNNKGVFVAIQIVIEKLVFGGDGMGYLPDGRAVFVPYVIPGEEVAIEIITEKKHFARAKLVEIIKPSEKRVIPVCPFFGICGGCHYQQLSYPHQIAAKRDILIDQFQRFAGIHISELLQVFSADSNLDYRNKIQLHVNSAGRLGYQMAHSKTIVPVDECHLTVGDFQDLLELLNFEENTAVERVSCRWDSNGELLILFRIDVRDLTTGKFSLISPVLTNLSKGFIPIFKIDKILASIFSYNNIGLIMILIRLYLI